MTTTYNHAEVERLLRIVHSDAIEDDDVDIAAMADQLEAARDRIATLESELDHIAPASERDHLSRAARRMVETVMGDRDALRQRVRDLERELATLRASVVAAMSSAGPEVGEDESAP